MHAKNEGVIIIYCVFNENLISYHAITHVRQLLEDRDGNRYPLVRDGKAIIRVKNGLYYGIINGDEVIAISDDIDEVEQRLKRAESNVEIVVIKDGRELSVEVYKLSKYSRVFRVAYSDTKAHGLIIAVDDFFNGDFSEIRLFYDFDKAVDYIQRRRGKDGDYYVYSPRLPENFREAVGGKDTFNIPPQLATVKHLKKAIEARKKAGSHAAYIEQVKKEKTAGKLINIYGSLDYRYGMSDEPEYDNWEDD